ncbi:MAG: hypothetical protein ACFHU9_00250 [Fluviicola sp.]
MKSLVFLVIFFGVISSCRVSPADINQGGSESNKTEHLDIFLKDSATINSEINRFINEDAKLNEYMQDNMIGLLLRCDTTNGDIIYVAQKFRLHPDSSCIVLIDYFESFGYINCAKDKYGKKISEYFILLHLRPNKLVYSVSRD